MKTYIAIALVICSVLVLCLNAESQTPVKQLRWQYAEFEVSTIGDKTFFNFVSPDVSKDSESMAEVYVALTGKQPVKRTADQSVDCIYLDILDGAGSRGWELVQERAGEARFDKSYIFKRPAD